MTLSPIGTASMRYMAENIKLVHHRVMFNTEIGTVLTTVSGMFPDICRVPVQESNIEDWSGISLSSLPKQCRHLGEGKWYFASVIYSSYMEPWIKYRVHCLLSLSYVNLLISLNTLDRYSCALFVRMRSRLCSEW